MASESENLTVPEAVQDLADQLVARAEVRGDSCVELSELSEIIQEAELGDDEAQMVHDLLQERGLDLRDDAVAKPSSRLATPTATSRSGPPMRCRCSSRRFAAIRS